MFACRGEQASQVQAARAEVSDREEELAHQVAEQQNALRAAREALAGARLESARKEAELTAERDRAVQRETALQARVRSLEESARQAGSWYLRLDDASVFGPVPIVELYNWAAQCRIGPDHEVSTDKTTWVPAREVPGLRMDWMVRLVDGAQYGPLNLVAVHHLLGDASVDPASDAVNRKTGEKIPVGQLASPEAAELREANARMLVELQAMEKALRDKTEQLHKVEQELAAQRPAPPAGPPKAVRLQVLRHAESRKTP